jgi:hypothetical protein
VGGCVGAMGQWGDAVRCGAVVCGWRGRRVEAEKQVEGREELGRGASRFRCL